MDVSALHVGEKTVDRPRHRPTGTHVSRLEFPSNSYDYTRFRRTYAPYVPVPPAYGGHVGVPEQLVSNALSNHGLPPLCPFLHAAERLPLVVNVHFLQDDILLMIVSGVLCVPLDP